MEENEIQKKSFSTDIEMSTAVLYDYLVHHAYSGTAGILGTCAGALGIMFFIKSGGTAYIYLILGLVIIFYLPVKLRLQAAKTMQLNSAYKAPLHYVLDENGITVSQNEETQTIAWDKCIKAVSTKQSIAVYTGKNNASLFPRKQLGDNLPAFVAVLAENMEPGKVRIRY